VQIKAMYSHDRKGKRY